MKQMKKMTLLMVFIAINISTTFAQESVNFLTYNIRFDNPNDLGNLWQDRSRHLINLLKFHQADIIGTQEGLKNQLEDIKSELNFNYVGIGRDFGDNRGEFSAIFYNPEKFTVLEEGTFWLSEQPDTPSKSWDAALNRICTWAKFRSLENDFYVFNVHFDHLGQISRVNSSQLVLKKIFALNTNSLPVVLMGDFNVTDENEAYTEVINSKYLVDSFSSPGFVSLDILNSRSFPLESIPYRRNLKYQKPAIVFDYRQFFTGT
jgi:endonuclease/exonuclease/phosphatase family metal-dependent hydrolase